MLVAFAGLCACSPSVFNCEDDSGCAGAQVGGICESSGFCSFPDETCPSGRRYGEFSGRDLGEVCVDIPTQTSTGATSQPGPTASTGLTTSLGTSTTASGGTTGSTDPGDPDATGSSTPSTQGSSTAGVCREGWWDCAWTVRQSVTLHGITLDVPVNALPFSASVDPTLLEDESLVFVDESGALVPWERDGTLAWLSMDVVPDTDAVVWAYGGNPSGPPQGPVGSVWDDNFVAIWHLSDGTDASAFGNDAAPSGVVPEDGQFDTATRFDGVDDNLDVPATPSLADLRTTGLTAEVWLRPAIATGETFKRIFDKTDSTATRVGWGIFLARTTPMANIQVDIGYELTEGRAISGTFEATGWVHLVVTIDEDDTVAFWVNGEALTATQTPIEGTVLSDADQPGSLGSFPGDGPSSVRFYDGLMDEFRIARGVRSESWVVATYTSGLPDAVSLGRPEELE
ncbi:MAG: LamG domain-containing protein [Nannocystaceae bacterium]|nr:LamG domain-containing protein [Nannocystaceae bacterium]